MGKKRILICDDDADILDVCRVILGKKNYEVITSTDCESIFPRLKDINPDLVLMDLWIPIMGGEACTKLLKKNDITRNVPVVLFSANNEIEQISKRVNADGFLRKPFDIRELVNTIEKHLLNPATA
jgi:DNA-binding response OmpR family regulator